MGKLVLIVEGEGEIEAGRLLVQRLLYEQFQRYEFQQFEIVKAEGNQDITKVGGLERHLERARRIPECIGLLVLLDREAENPKCPPEIAHDLSRRASQLGLPFPLAIVCANCEYESWFLASLHTIKGKRGIPINAIFEGNPENKCNAKEWLTAQKPPGRVYKETQDQPVMTALLDIPHLIEHSRSFRRMAQAVADLILAIDQKKTTVTPLV